MIIKLLTDDNLKRTGDEIYNLIEEYNINDNYVNENLVTVNKVGRLLGFRYDKSDEKTIIRGWQCNLACLEKQSMKLPTIITIVTDKENIITDIDLHESFKGSQGMPCSRSYLNRRLRTLVGTELTACNEKISDQLYLCCRHTFELVYGITHFAEWCRMEGKDSAYFSEASIGFQHDDNIELFDSISLDGEKTEEKITINNFLGNVSYDKDGAVCRCTDMKFAGYDRFDSPDPYNLKELTAEDKYEYQLRLMKQLSRYWIHVRKELGIKSGFYFTNMWPTALFGVISQLLSISAFSNNYAYFQYTVAGIQRDNGKCYCIGVIQDIEEGERLFEGFSIDDLY